MSIPSPLVAVHKTEKKNEVVLKLRLAGAGGTPQIRRVRLPRIQKSSGKVSYSALVDVAINCTYPDTKNDAKDFDCILTYYDIDNDCVTIASTEELVDAIEQFSSEESPVLRITTDVKKKEVCTFSSPENPVQPAKFPASETNHFPGKPPAPINAKPNQLQHIVESCVSVLAAAVITLKDQVAEMGPHPGPLSTGTNEVNVGTAHTDHPTETESAEHLAKQVVENIEMKDAEPTNANVNQQEERPFIHGRHTCDGCLCTPIIGIRYHSTNLPDYDLCAKCRDNYKGSEIQFETSELDRDRPFQERWYRKRARFSVRRGACHSHVARSRGQCSGPDSPHCHRGQLNWFRADQDAGIDAALKEAIRRSLQDVHVEKEKEPVPSTPSDGNILDSEKITKNADDEKSTSAPEITKSDSTNADDAKSATTPEFHERKEIAPVVTSSVAHQAITETSFSSDAAGHGFVAETLGQTLDECAQAIDAMVSELDRHHPIESTIEMDSDDDSTISGFSLPKMVVENTTEEEASAGEKIIDGSFVSERDAGVDDKSEASEDEWQVVHEDEQIASDEVIARAAQLIGSALFQSDLRGSEERDASTVTTSGNFELGSDSVPSSVPSMSSQTQISFAVLDRWALHLSQLHDLGFHNNVKNVDILERIKAAKIGVDDDDEVSVTQVVNMLLK